MAKKRKSSVQNFERQLPNASETTEAMKLQKKKEDAKVLASEQKKRIDKIVPEEKPKVQIGRPVTKGHRVKFSTMLDPAIKKKLNIIAAMEERTVADIFEEIALSFIEQHPEVK